MVEPRERRSIDEDYLTIISGIGPDSKCWLFCLHDNGESASEVEEIDYVGSFGLTVLEDRLYRILTSVSERGATSELLTYDAKGILAYRRLDDLSDPHGIVWDGTRFAIPCSSTNEIVYVDADGRRVGTWRAPGEDDSWHVNGVFLKDGRLIASAFGQFSTRAELAAAMDSEHKCGVIFDVASGVPIVSALDCPHDPVFVDDLWVVCNSRQRQILQVDPLRGVAIKHVQLNGWARGVAYSDDVFYVGESGERYPNGKPRSASVAIIDRKTFTLMRRIELPCREIHSMCLVPRKLISGLRRGFRTNAYRVSGQDQLAMLASLGNLNPQNLWTATTRLSEEACNVSLEASAPVAVFAGASFEVTLSIENRSAEAIFTAPPFPVSIGYRWRDVGSTNPPVEADERRSLPTVIAPGRTLQTTFRTRAPEEPGTYELTVSLVQDPVRWFDSVDETNAVSLMLRVAAANPRPHFDAQISAVRRFEEQLTAAMIPTNS